MADKILETLNKMLDGFFFGVGFALALALFVWFGLRFS